MKFQSFTKHVIALAVLSTAALSASAMTVDVGIVNVGDSFSQVIQKRVGSFSDRWNFTIATPLFAAGSVSNLAITLPSNLKIFNVADLSAKLFAGSGMLIDDLDDNVGSSDQFKSGSGVFAPGDYYFTVSGLSNGTMGGQYVFAVTTAPIPEPEAYAMFLAGLGIMGAIAARRNKAKKQG